MSNKAHPFPSSTFRRLTMNIITSDSITTTVLLDSLEFVNKLYLLDILDDVEQLDAEVDTLSNFIKKDLEEILI